VNITITEAVLFAIRCGINQATDIPGISRIFVITDLLHTTRRIFDSSLHLFQIHSASMSGTVHTGVEVYRMDLKMSGLVK